MADLELQILMTAYYRSLDMKPEEIGSIIGISSPTVSRRLNEAKQRGFLKELLVCDIPEEKIETVYSQVSDYPRAKRFLSFFIGS